MKINNLFNFSLCLIVFVVLLSCSDSSPTTNTAKNETRLDTLISYDQLGGTIVKVVKLHLDDIVTTTDTVLILDPDTYEETVKVNTVSGPRQEIVSMDYIAKE